MSLPGVDRFSTHTRHACEGTASPVDAATLGACSPPRIIAKWILYASQRMVVPEIVPQENETEDVFAVRSIADIPSADTCIDVGEPVMTLLAAHDLAKCRLRMVQLEQEWTTRLDIVDDAFARIAL